MRGEVFGMLMLLLTIKDYRVMYGLVLHDYMDLAHHNSRINGGVGGL